MFKLYALFRLALNKLISPNGWIDNTMTCGANGILEIIKKGTHLSVSLEKIFCTL